MRQKYDLYCLSYHFLTPTLHSQWNGTTFGGITKINGTSNSDPNLWHSIFNNNANGGTNGGGFIQQGTGYDYFCYQTLASGQHFLFAYFDDIDETVILIMSGPKTATVGSTVECTSTLLVYLPLFIQHVLVCTDAVPYARGNTYVNDLSVDTTVGQSVYGEYTGDDDNADSTVSITFTKPGTYNMKAHCPTGSACVRSNHVVTVVS